MAVTPQGIIGKENTLPWDYPEEQAYFRQKTKGHVIVMGRKTFEMLPSSLFIERTPVVFSHTDSLKSTGAIFIRCMEDFHHLIESFPNQTIFMIGGAKIAHLFLRATLISEFFLTKIHNPYSGDAYLDLRFFDGWKEEVLTSNSKYTIFKLQNPMEIKADTDLNERQLDLG